jgi:hypothetical protein
LCRESLNGYDFNAGINVTKIMKDRHLGATAINRPCIGAELDVEPDLVLHKLDFPRGAFIHRRRLCTVIAEVD